MSNRKQEATGSQCPLTVYLGFYRPLTPENCPLLLIYKLEIPLYYPHLKFGAIAQLGERNTGSVEVGGSIPPSSTKFASFQSLSILYFPDRVSRSGRIDISCPSRMPGLFVDDSQ